MTSVNEVTSKDIFLSQLTTTARQIEVEWEKLTAGGAPGELIAITHRLAGAALSLGYSQIGEAALLVENRLRQAFPPTYSEFANDWIDIRKFIAELHTEIDARVQDEMIEHRQPMDDSVDNLLSLQETRATNIIYMVEDDPIQADNLATQIQHFGYIVKTFAHAQDLRTALQSVRPAAILMDIALPEGSLAGIEAVDSLQQEYEQLPPVFFISVHSDLPTRLQAARAGGKAYFTKPIDVGELVDALDILIVLADPDPYRVLIVDDSEVQAKINALHLKKADISTLIVNRPLDLLQALEEFNPDLLLLDLYMPECTGLELAQVIRQMKAHVSLPIVYLSAESDREKQLAAIGQGGDDFLTKPIKPDHLVSSVSSRIERYRQLRALMLRDSLTGLFNHTTLIERLEHEISRASRQDLPLALAMIDLDHFKNVNDTYGHATGDRVLKSLAHMLTRRLRQSDIIGRYGGEEFMVIFPNTQGTEAAYVMDELRTIFAQIRHLSGSREFNVTFSCGVAAYPEQLTPSNLSEASDQALYEAKHQGRNRVVLANQ